jgi:FAD/FMN-containing dehydrogenase
MDDALGGEALEAIEEIFGDRVKRHPIDGEQGTSGALVSVLPLSTHEVELPAKVAERYSIPLVAQGAGTGPESAVQPGSVLIRFDLMRSL